MFFWQLWGSFIPRATRMHVDILLGTIHQTEQVQWMANRLMMAEHSTGLQIIL